MGQHAALHARPASSPKAHLGRADLAAGADGPVPPAPAAGGFDGPAIVSAGIAAVAAAELLLVFISVSAGAVAYSLLTVGLLAQQVSADRSIYRRALLALALVPLSRLMVLALILPAFPTAGWSMLAAVGMLFGAALMQRALPARPTDGGPPRTDDRTVLALVLALAALGSIVGALAAPSTAMLSAIWLAPLSLGLTAIAEEVVFRGVIQRALRDAFGRGAIVYANIPFVAVYLGTRSPGFLLVIAVLGLAFGWATDRSRSLLPALAGHILFALGAGLLWPMVGDAIL